MTDDELPEEFAKVWGDAQCNLSRLQELAPTSGAEAAVEEATEALERSKDLTAKAVEIATEDDDD